MKTKIRLTIVLSLICCAVLMTGCATLHPVAVSPAGPGFFDGIGHGLIAPFAFIGRLFSDTIAVYEAPNSGAWYDFGFLIGLSAWAGGSSAASR